MYCWGYKRGRPWYGTPPPPEPPLKVKYCVKCGGSCEGHGRVLYVNGIYQPLLKGSKRAQG